MTNTSTLTIPGESQAACKICSSPRLSVFAHVAACRSCGAWMNYPYLPAREDDAMVREVSPQEHADMQARWLNIQVMSGERNHRNFTRMIEFAFSPQDRRRGLDVLDFGAGGGQFALVLRSLYPRAHVHSVDLNDHALLDDFRPLQRQIPFRSFSHDATRFDVVMMNDVFEHVSDPVGVLRMLRAKLKPGGRIFIDTPKVFWVYRLLRFAKQGRKLKAVVDHDHQQIWTAQSFHHAARSAGLTVQKFATLSEYTQPASYYLYNMGITSPAVKLAGHAFLAVAPLVARNKIMAVLT